MLNILVPNNQLSFLILHYLIQGTDTQLWSSSLNQPLIPLAYTLALPEGRLSHATGTGYLRVIYGISAGEMTDDGWQMTVEKERAEVKIRNREEKA